MSYKTYRVQGIPTTYNREESRLLLKSILDRDNENPEPIIHSLCVDPSSSVGKRDQTATVSFKQDPKVFQDERSEWVLPIPRLRSFWDRTSTSSIKVDSHFLGFTPLNGFEDDSDHKIE